MGAEIKLPVDSGEFGGGGLWAPQEMWARGKGKLQLVFCCRAKDKTGGLELDGRSEGLQLIYLVPWPAQLVCSQ